MVGFIRQTVGNILPCFAFEVATNASAVRRHHTEFFNTMLRTARLFAEVAANDHAMASERQWTLRLPVTFPSDERRVPLSGGCRTTANLGCSEFRVDGEEGKPRVAAARSGRCVCDGVWVCRGRGSSAHTDSPSQQKRSRGRLEDRPSDKCSRRPCHRGLSPRMIAAQFGGLKWMDGPVWTPA